MSDAKWLKFFGVEAKVSPWQDAKGNEKIKIEMLRYSAALVAELREMEGSKFEGNSIWTVKATPRNMFSLDLLCDGKFTGQAERYSISPPEWPFQDMEMWKHQAVMAAWARTRRRYINAGEMGTGKTLATLNAIKHAVANGMKGSKWWIGPNSGLTALRTQLYKWGFQSRQFCADNLFSQGDKIFNYHNLENQMDQATDWPQIVVMDEFHACKAPNTRRTQLAIQLSINMEKRWGDDCLFIGLTGTPAPQDHNDWWSLAEIVRPGFLRESSFQKYKYRVGVYSMVDREDGGSAYPKFDHWKNHTPIVRCAYCQRHVGDYHSATCIYLTSQIDAMVGMVGHIIAYNKVVAGNNTTIDTKCTNPKCEVCTILPKRLEGLVLVTWKRDCMDLPEKIYEVIELSPTTSTIRVAKSLKRLYSGAQLQTKLRELSDGFQYSINEHEMATIPATVQDQARTTQIGSTPKDQALKDILEEVGEVVPRIVIYAAFTASVDRCVKLCLEEGWQVWRYDGRGSHFITTKMQAALGESVPYGLSEIEFQDIQMHKQKIAFVGNPEAAGQGLTLTPANTIVYYSNSFKSQYRVQSEDRIHRFGASKERGCKIIDLIHLPTDRLVLDKIKAKRDAEVMTLSEIEEALPD